MKNQRAFTLIEVVVAMGIVAFALISLLALIPLGLKTASDAVNDTRTSLIAQDAALRIRTLTPFTPPADSSARVTQAWWYDANGRYVSTNNGAGTPNYSQALYRVDASRAPLNSYPTNTDPANRDTANTYATALMGITVLVSSPVNTNTGAVPAASSATNTYTFYARVIPNL